MLFVMFLGFKCESKMVWTYFRYIIQEVILFGRNFSKLVHAGGVCAYRLVT